jgi:hypothetical protein
MICAMGDAKQRVISALLSSNREVAAMINLV